MRILVVEDERRLAKALVHILSEAGYEAEAVYTGDDGLHYAGTQAYDLVVLDVMLPGMDGFSVVKALRRRHQRVPMLMLTAKSSVADKVSGLDAGADDYLTKPFDPEELLARVRALLRRRQLMTILLDNAIKYAGGERKVTVTLAQKHDGVELRVRNTGSPIPADALPHIFDRFYRESAHRPGDGFGLGLAIARQIVQRHRGDIRATSTADEGTTLIVRLPQGAHRRPARITKM